MFGIGKSRKRRRAKKFADERELNFLHNYEIGE